MKRAVILAFVFFLTIFIVGLVNAFEARNVNTGEVINIQDIEVLNKRTFTKENLSYLWL